MTDVDDLSALAFPYEEMKGRRLRKRNLKLAHYTTADTAVKIIRGGSIWLRNASNMNDYREVQHGSDCLKKALRDHGQMFVETLDVFGVGFANSILQSLDSADFNARFHTYLTCVSEHLATDTTGRLSMWRAYGGPIAGVALVFDPLFLDFESSDLAVWSSPVLYGDDERFSVQFLNVLDNLRSNRELMQRVGPDTVRNIVLNALKFGILTTKHVGFQEEREWRLIHMPRDMASAIVQPTFQSIGGAPEQVYHLPLKDEFGRRPDYNLDKLLHRVIIGPCQNVIQIASTIEDALREVGVTDPADRISLSLIPLRQRV